MSASSNSSPTTRLFFMMFLEFFIWGAWLPLIFGYLPGIGFTPFQQSLILNAFPIGAITALFFSTQFVDRNFASEKFMALSHLIGGISIISLVFVKSFPIFFLLMLVHCLFYVPTISIANGIAFTHMQNAKRQFGIVRMGGTIGWIAASWPFVFILVDWGEVPSFGTVPFGEWAGAMFGSNLEGDANLSRTSWTFIVAGIASLILALYSLTLPHTPPKKATGINKLAWLEAARFLKYPFIFVLFIVTFLDGFLLQAYFAWTGTFLQSIGFASKWIMPIMSVGQIAEILTMLVLAYFLAKLGWKWTMILGVLGHLVRFLVFAFFPDHGWLIILTNTLHGICYAFFFATLYIFVDEVFPKDARSSAQGLFNLLILGLGPLVAYFLCPIFRDLTSANYQLLFSTAAGVALLTALLLALFFKPPANLEAFGETPGD